MTKMEMIIKINELSIQCYGRKDFRGFNILYSKTKTQLKEIIRSYNLLLEMKRKNSEE